MGSTDAWAELDAKVLAALDSEQPRNASELELDLPPQHVRAALKQHAKSGLAAVHHDASRTSYTITEAGKSHLAAVMEVA
jgi:DNA-binding PadR family transcriptional regulator